MNDNQTIEIGKYIFSLITSKYDFLNRILSLRKYLNWRSKAVKQMRFFESYKLLDIVTGAGGFAIDPINNHSISWFTEKR